MATGKDATYSGQSKFYIKQQPAGTTFNGNTIVTEEVLDVGSLTSQFGVQAFNGQVLPGLIKFTIAPNGANICKVSIQIADNGNQNITQTDGITPTVFDCDVVLSQANGTLHGTAPSTGLSVVTGTLFSTYSPSASRAMYIQSNSSGLIEVNITDTAKTGYFVMVQGGTQPIPSLSRQLVAGDYG